MIRRLAWLIVGIGLLWVASSYPAWRLGGTEALTYSTLAALLCLVPAVGTLLLVVRGERGGPNLALLLMLGGSGLRMTVVLGAGLAICLGGLPGLPPVRIVPFWVWILGFYLATLALEVTLLLGGQRDV